MKAIESAFIAAKDCSPIGGVRQGSDEEKWLREVCKQADIEKVTLQFGRFRESDAEPLASYDSGSGVWMAGRYVGEIQYKGRTLRIEPRFGMPVLQKWLAHIWGIKLLPTIGEQTTDRVWLWWLLAYLWSSRLTRSARHGLPCVRMSETSRSRFLKGRIRVRETGFEMSRGTGCLVSDYRERRVDPSISGVLVAAHKALEDNLRGIGGPAEWLSPRGKELVAGLRASVSRLDLQRAVTKDSAIRFTPMTELYKPVVELSKSILRHRPATGTKKGKKQVYGVLLDIAEVWEYYVFRLMQESLPQMEVVHAGRDLKSDQYLLRSQTSDRRLGRLYPDICVRRFGSISFDYIIDAKYKAALHGKHYRDQPQREDLYQITSYLAALGRRDGATIGVLAYPITGEEQTTNSWQSGNPWVFSSGDIGKILLLGIHVEQEVSFGSGDLESYFTQ